MSETTANSVQKSKPPFHQLMLDRLDKKLPAPGPKAGNFGDIALTTQYLAQGHIPGAEIKSVLQKLQDIADRNRVNASMLNALIAALKKDYDDFVR